jgi:hypothetical protein
MKLAFCIGILCLGTTLPLHVAADSGDGSLVTFKCQANSGGTATCVATTDSTGITEAACMAVCIQQESEVQAVPVRSNAYSICCSSTPPLPPPKLTYLVVDASRLMHFQSLSFLSIHEQCISLYVINVVNNNCYAHHLFHNRTVLNSCQSRSCHARIF